MVSSLVLYWWGSWSFLLGQFPNFDFDMLKKVPDFLFFCLSLKASCRNDASSPELQRDPPHRFGCCLLAVKKAQSPALDAQVIFPDICSHPPCGTPQLPDSGCFHQSPCLFVISWSQGCAHRAVSPPPPPWNLPKEFFPSPVITNVLHSLDILFATLFLPAGRLLVGYVLFLFIVLTLCSLHWHTWPPKQSCCVGFVL